MIEYILDTLMSTQIGSHEQLNDMAGLTDLALIDLTLLLFWHVNSL